MAISGGDGSIVLTTKVDESGINKGTQSIQSKVAKLAAEYRKAGMTQSDAMKKAWQETNRLKASTDKASKSVKGFGKQAQDSGSQAKTAFSGLKNALSNLAGVVATAFSISTLVNFSKEAANVAMSTEASVQRLIDIYGQASNTVGDFIDANARALGMSKSAAASFSSVYGNLFGSWADQLTNAQLTTDYLQMTAVVASKTGRTVEDVQERIRSGLLGNTEAIEDLGIFVNVKTIEMTDAFQRMADGRPWNQLDAYTQQQIRTFAILEQATSKYGNEVANTASFAKAQFLAAYQDFQNTWGQIVNTVLVPTLQIGTQILDVFTKGLQVIAGLSSSLLGKEQAQISASVSSNIAGAVSNQEALTEETKNTLKAQKKLLASFDEAQILSQGSAGGGTGRSAGTGTVGGAGISTSGGGNSSNIQSEVDLLMAGLTATVALGLAVIGVILLCFGQIAWGIGFIIAGAFVYGVTMAAISDSSKISDDVKGLITALSLIIGGALIVIGIILICTGVGIAAGIGLILAGVEGLVGAVALNWDFVKDKVEKVIEVLKSSLFVGFALIVLGILLMASGVGIAYGFALLIAGLASVGYQSIVPNWDYIVEKVKGIWDSIVKIWQEDIEPGFLEVKRAWDELYEELEPAVIWLKDDVLKPLSNFFKSVFFADIKTTLEAIGSIFSIVFTGAGGIISGLLERLKGLLTFLKGVFTFDIKTMLSGLAQMSLGTINVLLSVVESGINLLATFINKFLGNANNLLSSAASVIGIDIKGKLPQFPMIDIPKVSLPTTIPALAQGGVIPPNKEFLAILGDNKQENEIVSPVSTMKQAFVEAMAEYGAGQMQREEHYYIGETEVMALLYRLAKGGERLHGESLIAGGAY